MSASLRGRSVASVAAWTRSTLAALFRWLPIAVVVAVTALMAIQHLPRIVPFQWAILRYPFAAQGSESLIVYEAGLLARGESIYQENGPDRHGFLSGPYTPLYSIAVAATLTLTPTVYAGGRAITLVSWLVLLATLGALAWRGRDRRTGALGAVTAIVALAVFTPGVIWSVRVKPTIPALALSALGLLIVQRTYRSRRGPYFWALLPFVAAFYTKQTAVAAPAAATIFLLVHAGWRRALVFAGCGAFAGGAIFLACDLATNGQFYRHIVGDHRLPWHAQLLRNYGGLLLRDYWPLLAAGAVAALALVVARVRSVAPYYLLVTAALLPTVGVVGADHDHLIEIVLAAALAVGAALATTAPALIGAQAPTKGQRGATALRWSAYPLAALLLAQLVTGWMPDRWYAAELARPDPKVRRQLELIVTNLRGTPGDALAEDVGLLVLAGKPVPYDDPLTMAALARLGRWDQRQLLDDINNRRFSLILLPANPRTELWTPEVLAAIRANYDLKFRDVWFTWEAKRRR